MVKHNNVIPNVHGHKHWQERVRTWFNQPARKQRRRAARAAKAAAIFPRPVAGPLRPIVNPPTARYNSKVRLGRGFTLSELKEAGVNPLQALSIGIAVDKRRQNKSERSLKINVQRLKQYKAKLVLFPRDAKKPKAGEASAEERSKAQQQTGTVLPLKKAKFTVDVVDVKAVDPNASNAYKSLINARSDARLIGVREKRAKAKAEQEKLAAAKAAKTQMKGGAEE